MKRPVLTLLASASLALPLAAAAALPANAVNLRDLQTLMAFVQQYPYVAATVTSLDLQDRVVRYGVGCRAIFEREAQDHKPGWTGPQARLVFKSATCSLTEAPK